VKPEQVRRPADAFIGFAACGITGENQNCDFPVVGIPVRKKALDVFEGVNPF
jgi:hypothetical protein